MTFDPYPCSHGGQPDPGKVLSAFRAANKGRFELQAAICSFCLLLSSTRSSCLSFLGVMSLSHQR